MRVLGLTPILNVSNIRESFAWFEKLGWKKGWDWGDSPCFGGVLERFRTRRSDKGVWMSIWIENVDAVYQHCVAQELEVAWPPTNMPWGVRKMRVRHPMGTFFDSARLLKKVLSSKVHLILVP